MHKKHTYSRRKGKEVLLFTNLNTLKRLQINVGEDVWKR